MSLFPRSGSAPATCLTPPGEKRYEVNSQDLQGWKNQVSRVHISTRSAHWNQFGILFNWFSAVPFTEQRRRNNASCWLAVSSTHSPCHLCKPARSNQQPPANKKGGKKQPLLKLWKWMREKSVSEKYPCQKALSRATNKKFPTRLLGTAEKKMVQMWVGWN